MCSTIMQSLTFITFMVCEKIPMFKFLTRRTPNDARFAHLLRAKPEIHPRQVCPLHGVDALN